MLTETATVVSLSADSVHLSTHRKTTCSGCSMKSGCGQYLLGKDESLLVLDDCGMAALLKQQTLSLGDQVQLGIEPAQLLVLTGWFYVLPLITLLLATMLAALAGLPDIYIAFCTFTGLTLGIAVTRYMLRTRSVGKQIRPQFSKANSPVKPTSQVQMPV